MTKLYEEDKHSSFMLVLDAKPTELVFKSFQHFLHVWQPRPVYYNQIIRWSWYRTDGSDAEIEGEKDELHMILLKPRLGEIHYVLIYVDKEEEPEIRQYLRENWQFMQECWQPISEEKA